MLDIFSQLKSFIKQRTTNIDNPVFALHYRITFILLLGFAIIVGTSKYFGDPIDCTHAVESTEHIVDNFCWFNSYIFVPENGAPYEPGMHPSVALFTTITGQNVVKPGYKIRYLHAYQWIEAIFFLQAALFFLPRYLWRYCWEKEKVQHLTKDDSLKQNENKERNAEIVKYFNQNSFQSVDYSTKFVICEVLNFVNALGQFLVLKSVLGLSGGDLWNDFVTSDSNHEWKSGISRVFPTLARCDVITPATGGNSYLSELCVLPMNIFTRKFYIFLWFYLIVLSVISGLALVYRVATVMSPGFRFWRFKRAERGIDKECANSLRSMGFGSWFLLDLMRKNISPVDFKNLVQEFKHFPSESAA